MQHDHPPHYTRYHESDGEEKDGEGDKQSVQILGDEILTCERGISQLRWRTGYIRRTIVLPKLSGGGGHDDDVDRDPEPERNGEEGGRDERNMASMS